MFKSKFNFTFSALLVVTMLCALMIGSVSIAGDEEGCPKKDSVQKGYDKNSDQEGCKGSKEAMEGTGKGLQTAGAPDFKIDHSISDLDSFKVVGVTMKTSLKDNKHVKDIPAFWEEAMKLDLMNKIPNIKTNEVMLGLVMDFENETDYTYMIGYKVTSAHEFPKGMVMKEIAKSKYVKFTVKGKMPNVIGPAWEHIFMMWFPGSNFEPAETPSFEWYDDRFKYKEVSEIDIYIPIVEKKK